MGTRGFSRGVHYWEVQIRTLNESSKGSIFIGVALADSSRWDGLAFVDYRVTHRHGDGGEQLYGTTVQAGDSVGVLLDMDHGTISFIKVQPPY